MTAASANHFEESLDAISSIMHHWPEKRVIYYDIGLRDSQIEQVGTTYNTFFHNDLWNANTSDGRNCLPLY